MLNFLLSDVCLLLAVGGNNIKSVVLDTLDGASFKLGAVDLTQFNSFCGHAVAQVIASHSTDMG
jgi:hypothetical protein